MYKSLKLIISLNLLSLINVLSGFLLITIIGVKFGLSDESDIYFACGTVVIFLLGIPQLLWEAMPPFFSAAKNNNTNEHIGLYLVVLSLIVFISIFLGALSYLVMSSLHSDERYLTVTIASLVFFIMRAIINFNNIILNLSQHYRSVQLLEILVTATSIAFLFALPENVLFAFKLYICQAIASAVVICLQSYMILRCRNKHGTYFSGFAETRSLVKKSFGLKMGSLIYNVKDILILNVFSTYADGAYSIYNISLKLASALNKIASTPVQSIFVTKINNIKNYAGNGDQFENITDLIIQTITLTTFLFVAGAAAQYLLIDILADLFKIENLIFFQSMLVLNIIYYFLIVLFYPFYHTLVAIRYTSPLLLLNIVFILVSFVASLATNDIQNILFVIIGLQGLLGVAMLLLSMKKINSMKVH